MDTTRVGQAAPDFEAAAFLPGQGFKTIRLSAYRGRWVVLCFYPGDFAFVRPTELTAIAVKHEELHDLGVEVLFISTDSDFTHKRWHDEELAGLVQGAIPFPMLSDPDGHIGEQYGVHDRTAGVDIRGRFLIDPAGVVQAMEAVTLPVGRNVADLIRQIRAFQQVWTPGGSAPAASRLGFSPPGTTWWGLRPDARC